MKRFVLTVIGIMVIQTLSGQNGIRAKVTVLNLADAFSRTEEVNLSRFVNGISYIKLETSNKCTISGSAQFEVTNDFVIVRQMGEARKWQILLFERNTGNFLREIGAAGRGPGEYMMYSLLPFNTVKKEIYALDFQGNILIYNLMGIFTGRIKMPELKEGEPTDARNTIVPAAFISIIEGDTFVMQVANGSGVEKRKLVLLSTDGNTKTFPNKLTWDANKIRGVYSPPPWGFGKFYIWNNKTNFIEIYCDTLYQVTKESMIPRYYFDWGKYNSPYSEQIWISDPKHFYDYFYVTDIHENKNFIFARIHYSRNDYTLIIEKDNSKITFCKILDSNVSGLYDDISGLMTVIPQDFTPKNEMIWVIQPISLFKWFKKNPERADNAYKKLRWLKDIDEFSNPIIAIGKSK